MTRDLIDRMGAKAECQHIAAAYEATGETDKQAAAEACDRAIAALPAVTVAPRYVFAEGETIDEMRYKFLASKEGQALYAQGDVKLAWVNEGDLYHPQPAALDLTPAPVTRPMIAQLVRYCPICDIADCATHRPAPVQPDPEDDLVYRRHRCAHVADGADPKCPICWPDDAQPDPAAHVNETPKTEHDAGNALSPAAIREAARVLLSDDAAISLMAEAPLDREHTPQDFEAARQIMRDALSALIQKEPTDDR